MSLETVTKSSGIQDNVTMYSIFANKFESFLNFYFCNVKLGVGLEKLNESSSLLIWDAFHSVKPVYKLGIYFFYVTIVFH
jgi:hypothetical protein